MGKLIVHELGGSLPGALCGSHLGALGLTVTAWRNADTASASALWGWDWSKTIREGAPGAAELANADVIIDGRPLDANPISGASVVCRILGDWDVGIADMPEVIAQARVGLMGYVGRHEAPPIRIGAPVVTFGTGIAATQAILAALSWCQRVAVPCTVEVTAIGVGVTLAGSLVTCESDPDERNGFASYQSAPPALGFACADGVIDVVFHRMDDGLARFCAWLGRPDVAEREIFKTRAGRLDHEAELRAELEPLLGNLTVDRVLQELESVGAIAARRFRISELTKHPQVQALDLLQSLQTPYGDMTVAQVPFTLNGERPPARSPRVARPS